VLLVGLAFGLSTASAASGAVAFVRVDQLGYAANGGKHAYLMSPAPERGATYSVRSASGTVVLTAPVVSRTGSWSKRFPFVYAVDFSRVSAPGTYSITVAGPAPASSPAFQVGQPATLYQSTLDNSLTFYRAERDGPNYIRSPLRTAPAHLNDRHAGTYLPPRTDSNGYFRGKLKALHRRINASGGWWDAGDYLKFVQTTSYTVDVMLVGVRDFPASMGRSSQGSDFTREARFGLNWLLRMWDDRTRTMYFQVGIGEGNSATVGDHDIWRLPQADDHYGAGKLQYRYIRHRPVFRAGPPRSLISPNLAGRDAAAFALCFQVFRYRAPTFAARCLRAGEHVFALADTHPRRLTTVIPYGFYPETEWRDDLELGAAELADALASGPLPRAVPHTRSPYYYLRKATWWARAYEHQPDAGDTLNLYDVSGLADYELYRAIARAGDPARLWIHRAGLLADMRRQLNHAIAQAGSDPFGTGYSWSSSDTVSHLTGLSVMASEYASLTGDVRYRAWSARWLDNVLGANPWGSSFIIGDGSSYPRCPQHQVANLMASPLLGGAVEGPTSSATSGLLDHMRRCPADGVDRFKVFNGHGAVFKDNVQSYSTDEPAIDLTASSPLAFAWQVGR
jgi:endoglucanase